MGLSGEMNMDVESSKPLPSAASWSEQYAQARVGYLNNPENRHYFDRWGARLPLITVAIPVAYPFYRWLIPAQTVLPNEGWRAFGSAILGGAKPSRPSTYFKFVQNAYAQLSTRYRDTTQGKAVFWLSYFAVEELGEAGYVPKPVVVPSAALLATLLQTKVELPSQVRSIVNMNLGEQAGKLTDAEFRAITRHVTFRAMRVMYGINIATLGALNGFGALGYGKASATLAASVAGNVVGAGPNKTLTTEILANAERVIAGETLPKRSVQETVRNGFHAAKKIDPRKLFGLIRLGLVKSANDVRTGNVAFFSLAATLTAAGMRVGWKWAENTTITAGEGLVAPALSLIRPHIAAVAANLPNAEDVAPFGMEGFDFLGPYSHSASPPRPSVPWSDDVIRVTAFAAVSIVSAPSRQQSKMAALPPTETYRQDVVTSELRFF